mgnify:CR=1 FL=1
MELKKKLGRRIKELRTLNNLKQAQLAELAGIATKSQSCIETGKNYPSADLIEKYAKIFKIDVSEVLNIAHEKEIDILYEEIQSMIKYANKEQIILIYKLIKNILY